MNSQGPGKRVTLGAGTLAGRRPASHPPGAVPYRGRSVGHSDSSDPDDPLRRRRYDAVPLAAKGRTSRPGHVVFRFGPVATAERAEDTYNRRRRQRALGKLTSAEYELAFATRAAVAA